MSTTRKQSDDWHKAKVLARWEGEGGALGREIKAPRRDPEPEAVSITAGRRSV